MKPPPETGIEPAPHALHLKADVVVVGGGLAGLTCAVGLSQHGLRVVVVERGSGLGGRASSSREPVTGDQIPIGPHILLSEYTNMLHLLDVLGTDRHVVWHDDEFITMVDGRHRISMRMSVLPAPFHFVPSLMADRRLATRDWLSNVRATLLALSLDEHAIARLDEVAAIAFLRRLGVTERYLKRFWAFTAFAIMNIPLERCSAGALMRFYRRLIGKRGYRIGFPDGGLGDLFAPGSLRLVQAHGGKILTQTAVSRIVCDQSHVRGVVLADGGRIDAPFCVAAVTPSALLECLPSALVARTPGFSALTRYRPSRYLSVFLWFDRKLTRERFWARLYEPDALNCDFYDLSNINRGWAERPSVIASNIIDAERVWQLGDETIIAGTRAELAEYLPESGRAKLVHAVVHRIPMAIPSPFVGVEKLRLAQTTPIAGLVLAGDWVQTALPPSMESACLSGWRAAEHVLSVAGRPSALARPHVELDRVAALLGCVTAALTRRWPM